MSSAKNHLQVNLASEVQSALLEAHEVLFERAGEAIFGPLNLRLCANELLLIEGDNGSGKTTLLRVLAGLLSATSGEVKIERGETLCNHILLGHHFGLKGELNALEHLRHLTGLYGQRAGIHAHAALASVGLNGYEEVSARTLSAGQRKRVALAGLLLLPQLVWLLDEPYANLDAEGQILVDRMLRAHLARGGAALITSHGLINPQIEQCRRLKLALRDPLPERAA